MLRKLLGLLHDALIYGASGVLSQLIGFLLLPLYTSYLTPLDYGILAMLTVVSGIFEPLARCGVTQALFRFYSLSKDKGDRRVILSMGLMTILVSTSVMLTLGMVFAGPIARWVTDDASTTNLLRLALLASAISTIAGVPLATLRSNRKVKTASAINLTQLIASIVITIVLVVRFEQGILGVLLGRLAGDILSAIGLFAVTAKSFVARVDAAKWRSMMVYGLPFMPHHLQSVALDLFGVYLVGQRLGIDQAGIYNIATRFAVPLSFTVGAIQQAWTAYKFHRYKNDENPAEFFRTVVTFYVAGLLYLWAGVSLWCPEMLRVMTPQEFHGAIWLIPIVALPRVAQGLYFMLGTGIELGGKSAHFPLITAAGLVTVVCSSLPLVSQWGAFGAALATTLGWLVMAAVAFIFARQQVVINYEWTSLSFFAALAIAIVTAGYMTQGLETTPRLLWALILSLTYPVVCVLVLLRSPNERERMQILLAKLTGRRPLNLRGVTSADATESH